MSTAYFEDIKLHEVYRSREYPLIDKDIIAFARQWDPQPFHLDPEFAKKTKFGGLTASGTHLVAICVKLGCEREPTPAWVAGLGWEKVKFLAPARPGDILVMEIETIAKRELKSDPTAGVTHFATRLLNQRGEAVLSIEGDAMVAKRPKP
jgi:acyl dehydratase